MMRLVIKNRYGSAAGGLRRYNGSGIFSSIGRKLFSSGLKKVINAASKANISQKVADAVVNGAKSVGQKLGKTAGQKVAKFADDKIQSFVGDKSQPTINNKKRKIIKKKRPLAPEEQQLQRKKITPTAAAITGTTIAAAITATIRHSCSG